MREATVLVCLPSAAPLATVHSDPLGGKNIALRGHGNPFAQTHPPSWSPCCRGCPTCRAGGGGQPDILMAQNDPHVALIILTTRM